MRLIDADELRATRGMFIYQTEDRDDVIATEAYRWELIEREAPTVKAIPVEWIEKQMAERENYGDFNTAGAIGYLLLSWEKENE